MRVCACGLGWPQAVREAYLGTSGHAARLAGCSYGLNTYSADALRVATVDVPCAVGAHAPPCWHWRAAAYAHGGLWALGAGCSSTHCMCVASSCAHLRCTHPGSSCPEALAHMQVGIPAALAWLRPLCNDSACRC